MELAIPEDDEFQIFDCVIEDLQKESRKDTDKAKEVLQYESDEIQEISGQDSEVIEKVSYKR